MKTLAAFIVFILYGLSPLNAQGLSGSPTVELWSGVQKLGDVENSFSYAIFSDGIVLQVHNDAGNPVVTVAATYVSSKTPGDNATDTFIFWHDVSVEVARIEMRRDGRMKYDIRDHTDRRQKGTGTLMKRSRVTGPEALGILQVYQSIRQAAAQKALLARLEQMRVANALGNNVDRLKEIQTEEFLKRLSIITSP